MLCLECELNECENDSPLCTECLDGAPILTLDGESESEAHEYHEEFESECTLCQSELRQSALDAGIPLSVIEGKSKLTYHFPQSYIDFKTGRE